MSCGYRWANIAPPHHVVVPPPPPIPWDKWIIGCVAVVLIGGAFIGSMVSSRREKIKETQDAARKVELDRDAAAREARDWEKNGPAREAREADLAARGPMPIASKWDGLTPEVNRYFKASLKDYDSLKIMECSVVGTYGKEYWIQTVKYRAKNGWGAYDIFKQGFLISQGEVVQAVDMQ